MSKKFNSIMLTATAFVLSASMLAACADGVSVEHKHAIYTKEATEATCTHEGNIKHDYCLYCGQCFLNGEEVDESEVTIPVNKDNHTAKVEYDQVSPTCTTTGVKAYWYCDDCGTYNIDGKEYSIFDENAQETISAALSLAVDPDAHSLVSVAKVEPTCVVPGAEAHMQCEHCGALYDAEGKKPVTAKEIEIASLGGHEFDGNFCTRCDGYKQYYDSNDNSKYVVIDGSNAYDFTAASVGATHTTSETSRGAAVKAMLEDRMTFSMQNGANATVTATGETWQVTQGGEKEVGSFTRFALDDGAGNPYKGKFVLTFDVSVSEGTTINRLGIKVVREYDKNGSEAVDPYDPEPGKVEFSKLIGTNSAEENNPDRVLTPGTVYRMKYVGETTEESQLIQLFTHIGPGVITLSNLHYVPLKDVPAEGIISAKLLSFAEASSKVDVPLPEPAPETYTVKVVDGVIKGSSATEGEFEEGEKITVVANDKDGFTFLGWYNGATQLSENKEFEYTVSGDVTLTAKYKDNSQPEPEPQPAYEAATSNTATTIDGKNFFDVANWKDGTVTKNEAGSLMFDSSSKARFDMFYVAQMDDSAKTWVHLGDNGADKTDNIPQIYGKEYTFTYKVSATGAFDILVLGSKDATTPMIGKNCMWLNIAADGTVTFNIGCGHEDRISNGEMTGSSSFAFGADKSNTVSLTLTRLDKATLTVQIAINGKTVPLTADTIAYPDYVSVEDGVAKYSKCLENTGFGQRVGFFPAADGTVIVSGMGIGIDGEDQTVVSPEPEPEPEPETVYEATTSANATNIKGDSFFDVANWTSVASSKPQKQGDSLVFTSDSASRFDLFHVAQNSSGDWVHLGDKGNDANKIPAIIDQIGGKVYTYTFEMSATGAFDLQVLGNKDASLIDDTHTARIWLRFAADGTLTLYFDKFEEEHRSWGELSYKTDFKFGEGQKNTVSVNLVRTSESVLKVGVVVNGKTVEFAGNIANTDYFAFDDGYLTVTNVLTTVGYGQRFGVMPAADSTVTISGMGIGIDGKDYSSTPSQS